VIGCTFVSEDHISTGAVFQNERNTSRYDMTCILIVIRSTDAVDGSEIPAARKFRDCLLHTFVESIKDTVCPIYCMICQLIDVLQMLRTLYTSPVLRGYNMEDESTSIRALEVRAHSDTNRCKMAHIPRHVTRHT
jgi:hypothetical protein